MVVLLSLASTDELCFLLCILSMFSSFFQRTINHFYQKRQYRDFLKRGFSNELAQTYGSPLSLILSLRKSVRENREAWSGTIATEEEASHKS